MDNPPFCVLPTLFSCRLTHRGLFFFLTRLSPFMVACCVGGFAIASHILIPTGGPVPDYVHFHKVLHFQFSALLGRCFVVLICGCVSIAS